MPLYRFHFSAGALLDLSDDAHYATLADAKRDAVATLGQILQDAGDVDWMNQEVSVTLQDAAGLSLFAVSVVAFDAPATRSLFPPPAT